MNSGLIHHKFGFFGCVWNKKVAPKIFPTFLDRFLNGVSSFYEPANEKVPTKGFTLTH